MVLKVIITRGDDYKITASASRNGTRLARVSAYSFDNFKKRYGGMVDMLRENGEAVRLIPDEEAYSVMGKICIDSVIENL